MLREGKLIAETPTGPETGNGTFFAPRAFEIDSIKRLSREVFGPILHVVRYEASRIEQVCEAINATGYGLTLGIHTRIEETADFIQARVRVGNLYVNRNQIGDRRRRATVRGRRSLRHGAQGRRSALPAPLRRRAGRCYKHDGGGRQC